MRREITTTTTQPWKWIFERNSGVIWSDLTGLPNLRLHYYWIVPLFFQKCFHPTSKSPNCRVSNQMSNLLQIVMQTPPISTKLKLYPDPALPWCPHEVTPTKPHLLSIILFSELPFNQPAFCQACVLDIHSLSIDHKHTIKQGEEHQLFTICFVMLIPIPWKN